MSDKRSPAQQASQASMAAVHAKDKARWLSLFAEDAHVEDPIGTSSLDPTGGGHKGKKAISDFWDTNVEPNRIVFNINASHAPVGSTEVANVGSIVTYLPAMNMTTTVNGVFVYRVDKDGKIVSLRAFWSWKHMAASGGVVQHPEPRL
mmetsp:Transcript_32479/g.71018  ORF Transcript_32479/g.71018 Transcript_32479/m.71018 type:complete len:148 (+) Transcript_32479:37-480(+)